MPVEVHCGDADVVTPPAACRGWADLYAAPFDLIKGAGHASPVEQPEAVARLITRAALKGPAHPETHLPFQGEQALPNRSQAT
ncbi:alpha/beta hydrolase [Polaromonas sp. P2-4]|nr:alpha/beta hydrolase [Polaromonas sp. P2-4]